MKLDFSKLKKNTENQQPTNTPQVDPTTQTGIKLSFTEGKTYDLDEIIANKLRDNENGTLVLRTIGDIQFRNRMIELVTKKILDDYGVEWTEDNWKLAETLAKVNNFSRVFDAYFTRYYEEYKKVINSGNFEGSFSIDTILRTIKLTKEDIRKYTLTDVCEHQTEFLNYSDRNRPLIIWTDGTNDCGCGDNGKSYDKLANDIKTTKELANNTKENLDANYYTKLEIEDKLDNLEISDEKLQSYYNKTETDKKIEDYTAENFYNKGEIDTKLSSFSPDNVYTKTEADSTFAKKTELETVTEHVKELPISTFNNDANYVTEENAATKADIETVKANIDGLNVELMSLPYIGQKANVYFSGAVETVMETALGDKFKNPMDLDEWSRLIADEPCGVIEHYADLPDNPKNVFFYGVTENNKLYNYSEDSKTWNDVTEAAQINFNIVYIGDDVSKVGTLDKNIYDGSGGVYIIHYRVSHPELKTNVIYKVPDFEKSIYTTNNKTVIYGTEFPLGTSNEINDLKVPEIADLIKSKNLNITDSILFEIGMCRTYGFLGPIDFDENDEQNREHTIHRVLFEKGKYILYLYNKKYSNNIPTYSIYREFNSLEDFSDFMLNSSDFVIKKDDVDLITIIREVIKIYKITPIFTNSSLNDNNIAVNNVIGADFEKKIYKFYIYNGEEFIELKTSNSYSNGGYSQKYNFKNISATASSSDVSKIISIDMSSLASVENYSILLSKITRLWENENIFSLSIRVKSSVVERYCINIMTQCTLIDMYDTASNSRGLVPNACFRFVGSDNIDGYVILNSNPLLKFCFSTEDMYNTFKAIATNLFATMSISFGLNVL